MYASIQMMLGHVHMIAEVKDRNTHSQKDGLHIFKQ
jgi:hypothetical protein